MRLAPRSLSVFLPVKITRDSASARPFAYRGRKTFSALVVCVMGPPPAATVTISSTGVTPAEVTLVVGGRVTFVNNDVVSHDIAGGPDPARPDCLEIKEAGFLVPGPDATGYTVPANLRDSYVSPVSFHVFVRYRPRRHDTVRASLTGTAHLRQGDLAPSSQPVNTQQSDKRPSHQSACQKIGRSLKDSVEQIAERSEDKDCAQQSVGGEDGGFAARDVFFERTVGTRDERSIPAIAGHL